MEKRYKFRTKGDLNNKKTNTLKITLNHIQSIKIEFFLNLGGIKNVSL